MQAVHEPPREVPRVLGRIRGNREGPTVLVLAGIHGNEYAGVAAARRVLESLQSDSSPIRGEFIALAGNLRALRGGTRYVQEDLNRRWNQDRIKSLRRASRDELSAPEDREQLELLDIIEEILLGVEREVYFLDLHTSSAFGCPFVTVGDTLRNRRFAMSLPLPLILGLEEQVDGSLLEYLNNLGLVTMGVEGGQHEDPSSVDHLEAVVWLSMVSAGQLDGRNAPDGSRRQALLEKATRGIPRVTEVIYRHAIMGDDGFRMEAGFKSFTRIREGELMARDRAGEVRAPLGGMALLPLYQGQGDDGFFIAREVRPFWLKLSALLRRLRLGPLVGLFPGVSKHPDREGGLVIDTRVARFFPMEILHLFGYRKHRRQGAYLVVDRRRFDLAPPGRA